MDAKISSWSRWRSLGNPATRGAGESWTISSEVAPPRIVTYRVPSWLTCLLPRLRVRGTPDTFSYPPQPASIPGVRVHSSFSISHPSIKHLVVSCLCPVWAHICSLYSVNPFWSEVLKISFESLSSWPTPCAHRGSRNTCDVDSVSEIACLG